jgi:dihydrofolate reductase
MFSIIAAMDRKKVIGYQNKLPWHLPADLQHFRDLTINKRIVMGFNTFESLGRRSLPHRNNVICLREGSPSLATAHGKGELTSTLPEILEYGELHPDEEIFIIGGGKVYQQLIPHTKRMYLTFIDHEFEGDTFFPEFAESEWNLICKEDHQPDNKNIYPYSFLLYQRKIT